MSSSDNDLKNELVQLLKARSLQRGSFTLSSGRHSNYYIDARRTTMSAAGMDLIGRLGLDLLRRSGWTADSIGGLTLGADPVAYAIALASHHTPPELNAFSVRKEAKRHGTGQFIEGCFAPGSRAVVVEDTLTTGASALRAVDAVRAAGGSVVGVLGVVDRLEGGLEAISRAGLPVHALVTVRDLGIEPPR
jgi:orotate phosphoribosyltransferase